MAPSPTLIHLFDQVCTKAIATSTKPQIRCFAAYVLNYFLDRMKVRTDMGLEDKLDKAFFMVCIVREVVKTKSAK